MTALRWTVGVAAALFIAAWIALVVIANGFRRSFGASPNAWWVAAAPVLVAALVLAAAVRGGGGRAPEPPPAGAAAEDGSA